MAGEYTGRRESIGFGIQGGSVAVAPQIWVPYLKNSLLPKTTVIENESALGRVESVNDSAIDAQWAEGPIEAKLGSVSIGYLLSSIMGLPVTTDNADANAAVKDHTFNVVQSNTPTYLTTAIYNPVADLRHALSVVDVLTISGERGGWVQWKAEIKAKDGTAATSTVAYGVEHEFTMKHVILKLASSVAGLGAATALELKRFEFVIERKTEMFIPSGSVEPTAFNSGDFVTSGEFVVRYNSTTHQTSFRNNTAQAMSLSMINTDVTIGTSANPGLVFTSPQTRFREFDRSDDLGAIVESTVGFKNELSLTDGYMTRAVLTNTQASYAAA